MSKLIRDLKLISHGLSIVDKLLPLLIIIAMVVGVLLSVYVPLSRTALNSVEIVGVSLPLAIGLIVMMIPPLCKVEWENFHNFFRSSTYLKPILVSLLLNWIICPFLMFGLAWLTLFDESEYRTGIIMIGLARCIAMVLLWNDIADGDNTLCAVIVLINSLLQVVLYAPYQIFFCYLITNTYDDGVGKVSYSFVAKSVAFFLGVPLGFGVVIRSVALVSIGIKNYEKNVLPYVSPWALIGLLYTIVVIFMEKGNDFIKDIRSALRCFVPLILYFTITWFGTFFLLRWFSTIGFLSKTKPTEIRKTKESATELHSADDDEKSPLCGCEEKIIMNPDKWSKGCQANYGEIITQTFTASSNNFELSLAIAISIYGSGSKEAIAATFGPLLEVPILLILAFVAQYFKIKFIWSDINDEATNTGVTSDEGNELEILV